MKSSAVRAQLEAIGFPDELHAQLDAALAHQAERSHTDPFSLVAQRVVCSDLIDHRQKAEAWPVVRVAPVQWLLPLRAAAERLGNDAKELPDAAGGKYAGSDVFVADGPPTPEQVILLWLQTIHSLLLLALH